VTPRSAIDLLCWVRATYELRRDAGVQRSAIKCPDKRQGAFATAASQSVG
jgi:hypothetical protein